MGVDKREIECEAERCPIIRETHDVKARGSVSAGGPNVLSITQPLFSPMPRTRSQVPRRISGVGSEHSHSSDSSLSEQEESHIDIVKVCIGKECSVSIRTGLPSPLLPDISYQCWEKRGAVTKTV